MPDDLLAREAPLKQILSDFHPKVPQLQRSYSWGQQEWSDLWEDLTDYISDSSCKGRPYFIGTIVLEAGGSETAILDGQQRLATIAILLNRLTERLRLFDDSAATTYSNDGLRKRRKKNEFEPYLTLNEYDGSFFRKFVLEGKSDEKPRYTSHKLIKKAYDFFDKKIDELFEGQPSLDRESWLDDFCFRILNDIFFVYVRSAPSDSHQVFRVLNDRGKSLSQLDLFRTFLLQKAKPSNKDEIAESWTRILDIQSPGNAEDLLRFYWISQHGDVKSRRLFRAIEDAVKDGVISADDLATDLFFYSDIYKSLVFPESGEETQEIKDLRSVVDLRAKSLYPLLMKCMYLVEDGDATKAEFAPLLHFLVSLYIRYTTIGAFDNSRLETELYRNAKSLGETLGVNDVLISLRKFAEERGLSDDWFVKEFSVASAANDTIGKAILRAIETSSYTSSEKTLPITRSLHLEHIYPKKPKPEDRLVDHDDYLYRFGNLTLMDGGLNSSASNLGFVEKLPRYSKSQIGMTTDLLKYDGWGKEQIIARQHQLAEVAKQIWSLDP